MRKCVCLALLILVSITAPANAAFGLSGGLGLSLINQELYLTTTVRPDISIGKLGIGLDLTLNFNQQGIRAADWDSWQKSLARSIRYVRWGHKGDSLYLQVGQLENASIGTGIIVSDYRNINTQALKEGERRIGFVGDLDLQYIGVETLVNDVVQPSVYAVRFFTHPTAFLPDNAFDKLTIGISMAQDTRSEAPYNELNMKAVDAYFPLAEPLRLYAHYAFITDHGDGWGVGARGRLGLISYLAELRQMDADFVASPFSKKYEDHGIDWANHPADGEATQGYLLGANLNLMNDDFVLGVKQELLSKGGVQRRSASLSVGGSFLRMFTGGRDASLSATYAQELIDPALGDANGYLDAAARISLFRGVYLNYSYKAVFPYDHSAPQSTMTGGVSFEF
ncbi:MAG: hypothetical protein ACOX44_14980 [Limnochordia bacterium]|jgi:hypothetical protein